MKIKWNIAKWFIKGYYKNYLFAELRGHDLRTKLTKIICRIKGHPYGPIWYSHGMEPDYRCKNCLDEI